MIPIDVATDPETYAKIQRFAEIVEEDPERARELMLEAAATVQGALEIEVQKFFNKHLLYEDQHRIYDGQTAASQDFLSIVNPAKKVTGTAGLGAALIKALPNKKLDLPDAPNGKPGNPNPGTRPGATDAEAGSPDGFAHGGVEGGVGSGTNILPTPRTVGNLKGGPLENATQVRGKFNLESGPPNGTVYRADNRGNITSYATYDSDGRILTRVDVTGATHNGIPTPHVVEYGRNTLPDGSIRVQTPRRDPRPANPDEIP